MSLTLMAAAAPYQKRTPHKLRATAVIELTTAQGGSVSTRVIPVTILADGSFRDASIYESRPRPLALGNGVVYEAQKTGVPAGYVTITSGSNTPEGWIAQGKWQPAGQGSARASAKPAAASPAPSDERPILHREGENPQPTPTPAPSQTPSAPSDDRPVLHRGGSDSPSPQPTPVPAPDETQTSSPSDSDRPVLHRSGADAAPPSQSTAPQQTSQPAAHPDDEPPPDDPNRPVLRRRKPPSAGEREVTPPPAASRPPAPTPTPNQSVTVPSPPANTPGTQMLVAVSDAQSSETRSYEFHWRPGEQAQIEAKMRKLALAQLPGESSQTNEHALTNVVIRSFDLDLSNDAVVVITAEVPGGYLSPAGKPARASATKIEGGKFVSRYVAVIARVDIDGNPQKLATSVTDSSRLDVAPRLELIDAVDVDGDGLAELMFREYDFDQKSFIIYGVGHGTVTKVFEGASEPIK